MTNEVPKKSFFTHLNCCKTHVKGDIYVNFPLRHFLENMTRIFICRNSTLDNYEIRNYLSFALGATFAYRFRFRHPGKCKIYRPNAFSTFQLFTGNERKHRQ